MEHTDPYLDLGRTPADEELDAKLEANLEQLAATPTVEEFEREQRARKRGQRALMAVIILTILGGYIFTALVARDVGASAARTEILDSTVRSLVQANDVRASQGLPAIPVDQVVAQLQDQGLVQAVSAAVLSQIEGDPRFRGADGSLGAPGAAGTAGAPGTTGSAGTNGTAGVNGQPGLSVIGPPGTNGNNGNDGQPGANGAKGDTGAPGADGAKGEKGDPGSAPASITINGQTCTPDAPGSTNYTCSFGG